MLTSQITDTAITQISHSNARTPDNNKEKQRPYILKVRDIRAVGRDNIYSSDLSIGLNNLENSANRLLFM